jgi:hypothetical protein
MIVKVQPRHNRRALHGWNGARWRRRSPAEICQRRWRLGHRSFRGITVDSHGVAQVGEYPWTPIPLGSPSAAQVSPGALAPRMPRSIKVDRSALSEASTRALGPGTNVTRRRRHRELRLKKSVPNMPAKKGHKSALSARPKNRLCASTCCCGLDGQQLLFVNVWRYASSPHMRAHIAGSQIAFTRI